MNLAAITRNSITAKNTNTNRATSDERVAAKKPVSVGRLAVLVAVARRTHRATETEKREKSHSKIAECGL
jgi:hypothetical protein